MTTAQIRVDILNALDEDSTDSTALARALRWTNKAYDKLIGFVPEAEFMQKSESTLDTVADQATYAMPEDFFQLLSLRDDTNKTIIVQITRQEFDRLHPDPSSESTGKPSEYTIEYDHDNKRFVIRLAPIPDDAYSLYAVTRVWPAELTASVDPIYSKLRTAIEEGGIYEGAKVIYADQEYTNYRAELKADRDEAFLSVSRILAKQKVIEPQIPIIMKKNHYYGGSVTRGRWS